MSAEILYGANTPYRGTDSLRPSGPIAHSAIHDLESFFWVLLYLCLTRDGPGGGRRNELSINEPLNAETKPIYAAVHTLFDSESDYILWNNKRKLFDHPEDLEKILLKRAHPYFDTLKPFISNWWNILRFGYNTYDDYYVAGSIHDRIIKLLEDELSALPGRNLYETLSADGVVRMQNKTDAEIERRKDDLEFNRLKIARISESLKRRSTHAGHQTLPTTPPKNSQEYLHDSDQAPA
jgi:hypothetical protein